MELNLGEINPNHDRWANCFPVYFVELCCCPSASVYTVYTWFRSRIFWGFVVRVHRTASFMVQVLKISLLGHRKRIIASLAERPYEEPPVKPPRLSQIRVRAAFIAFSFYSWNRMCINEVKSTFLPLQCHDLPVSQSSSPLSQMESSTGRSMDPLLPIGESGRKKVPDADFEVPHKHQSERHRSCVCITSLSARAAGVLLNAALQRSEFNYLVVLQEWYDEKPREPRLTLRPPSLAAPYALVQNWHHQPEKLIFESCAYEASVRSDPSPSWMT